MKTPFLFCFVVLCSLILSCTITDKSADAENNTDFRMVNYNSPIAISDVGIGLWAWPVPMNFDGDGNMFARLEPNA